MQNNLTKSKNRVRDHGEVFTPDFIVNDMINLVKQESERIDSRFLEPACGTGNFLVEILRRKLEIVKNRYKNSQFDFERNTVLAVSSLYGVDILEDNLEECRLNLFNLFENYYNKLFKKNVNEDYKKSVKYILDKNILLGNALNLKNPNNNQPIVFSEWSAVNHKLIKRRDFQFADLAEFDPKAPSLFSLKEESDSGEVIFSPQPIKEYKAVNFLELYKAYEE